MAVAMEAEGREVGLEAEGWGSRQVVVRTRDRARRARGGRVFRRAWGVGMPVDTTRSRGGGWARRAEGKGGAPGLRRRFVAPLSLHRQPQPQDERAVLFTHFAASRHTGTRMSVTRKMSSQDRLWCWRSSCFINFDHCEGRMHVAAASVPPAVATIGPVAGRWHARQAKQKVRILGTCHLPFEAQWPLAREGP